jgi:hypothetical protein
MTATYGKQRHEYHPGRRGNFNKSRTPRSSENTHTAAFPIKVLIGSTAIVVGSFLMSLPDSGRASSSLFLERNATNSEN